MSYQGSYPGGPDGYIDAEYTEVIETQPQPQLRSRKLHLLPRSTSAMVGEVMEEAMVLATHDRCLALLAKAGMEHAAALSMMELQFSGMTPQGAHRYSEIADAYAQKAADKVRRW